MRIDGRIAVVTGGASGIGRATCHAFAAGGGEVFVADIDEAGGAATADEIRAAGGVARLLPLDITDWAAARAAVETVRAAHGRLDILVNGVGWDRIQPFVDNTPEYCEEIIALNLLAAIKLTHAYLPLLFESDDGRVVNVASDAGRVGSMGETVYASAKGGVIAFTKSLARETARHGLKVNCVSPGPTDTPLFAAQPEKMREALVRATPLRRTAKPAEVADAILFFASPRSSFVTGQVLSVSGGLTMVD